MSYVYVSLSQILYLTQNRMIVKVCLQKVKLTQIGVQTVSPPLVHAVIKACMI